MNITLTPDPYISYYSTTMMGSVFNHLFGDQTFVKLTNETENHNNFQFNDGLNIDTILFTPMGHCNAGGIYFTDVRLIKKWIFYNNNMMKYMRKVIIPDDALVYIECDKFKADKLFLEPKTEINDEIYEELIKYTFNKESLLNTYS